MGADRTCFILKLARKRTAFNLLFFVIVGIFAKGSYLDILAGAPFILLGSFMRILSAGTIRKNEVLTNTGPYRVCRNPLYLGSFLISAGLVIVADSIFPLLFFIVFFPLIYIPAIFMEEEFLQRKFGEDYLLYRKCVPAFIPAVKKVDLTDFSWGRIKENREYTNWGIIFILIIITLIKSYLVFNK